MQSSTSGSSGPAPDSTPDAIFSEIESTLRSEGPGQALERLLKTLEEQKKYRELFDAMLLVKRQELGLPLVQVGQASDLADEFVPAFEEAIAGACRHVGELFLQEGDIVQAWQFFRALGDSGAVREAIEGIDPATRRKDVDGIVEMAIHEGIHPRRGLEMVVHHYGICSSITNFEQMRHTLRLDDQQACVGLLVSSLYKELADNLRAEIEEIEGAPVRERGLMELIESRPKLFGEDAYFIDSSHLWSIVGFSDVLDPGPDLDRAIELADYGSRLSSMYQYESQPPFDEFYEDHEVYLRAVRGLEKGDDPAAVSEAGERFVARARRALEEGKTDYPVGQMLTILSRIGRLRDAIEIARGFEKLLGPGRPFRPDVYELCQVAGEFDVLSDHARARNDVVSFAAGVIQRAAGERRAPPVKDEDRGSPAADARR